MNQQKGYSILELVFAIIALIGLGGWIANIVKLFGMNFESGVTVELVLRIVGIFAAPLGAIMGFL